jgi:hypothetical protein
MTVGNYSKNVQLSEKYIERALVLSRRTSPSAAHSQLDWMLESK